MSRDGFTGILHFRCFRCLHIKFFGVCVSYFPASCWLPARGMHSLSLMRYSKTCILCKYHPRDQPECCSYTQVVFICRFSNIESIHLGTCKMCVVFQAGGLYIQMVFRGGFTVSVSTAIFWTSLLIN